MKLITAFSAALCLAAAQAQNTKDLTVTGTYQIQVACHDTHHVELALLEVPGKCKFSSERHILQMTPDQQASLQPGLKISIKGQRMPALTRMMTKAQVRRQMFEHMTQRAGVPPQCATMGDIVSKLKTGKMDGAKSPCGHNHGNLKIVAAADDEELVEVSVPAHIKVSEVTILEGGAR